MAGKQQHYLPRFLQKGFASRIKGQEIYTWVFRKAQKPFETNIRSIGQERYFYGEPEKGSVDEEITSKEQDYAPILQELRNQASDTPIENGMITEFVVHLIIRTKNIRNTMGNIGNSFSKILQRNILKPESMESVLINFMKENHTEFRDMLQSELEKAGINAGPKLLDALLNIAMNQTPQLIRQNMPMMFFVLEKAFQLLDDGMSNTARNAQLKALSKEGTPSRFVEKISGLKWHLFVEHEPNLILGDIGPLATTKPGGDFRSLVFLREEDPYQVFLPLSDRHLVVGSKSDKMEKEEVDIINNASASLSTDFFIGSRVTDTTIHYANLIGSRTFPFSPEELHEFESILQAKTSTEEQ